MAGDRTLFSRSSRSSRDDIDERLREWITADAPIMIDSPSPSLSARRMWHCSLPEGEARIPCGGTHVSRTSELGPVRVSLSLQDAELTMRTVVGLPAQR
ncbi:hypothetical protein OG884_02330 [Streptosporangium sp. NBC_01755]|uniref:hypothetical protein n=1 Tax=unclassified Streptosporangium TaxID=2632669 RepID=UPI002DD9C9A4|nr:MULTISPECIES: hypothetical protein [unclassified Streptosporangium]WSA27727.1 hypothetical protein OIE13_07600 [Streptosporangium sp. NBC_01810]WSD00798.1 hypothetical protein OG884_02330 [Streptosporangium sp. NBC_01755]